VVGRALISPSYSDVYKLHPENVDAFLTRLFVGNLKCLRPLIHEFRMLVLTKLSSLHY
jgi:hypothetical protein